MILVDERLGLPSASKTDRWMECPGSHAAEAASPQEPPGPEAERGIRLHAILAGEAKAHQADDQEAVDKLKAIEEEVLRKWIKDCEVEAVLPTREYRLKLRNAQRVVLATGKPDVVYVGQSKAKTTCLILDYKTGEGIVSTAQNPQLCALGVMARQEYGAEEVSYAIIQAGNPAGYETLFDLDLKVWEQKLFLALERVHQAMPSRVAGKWCLYCRAAASCAEAHAATKALSIVPEQAVMDISKIPELLDACLMAEGVIDAVRARAKQLLRDGHALGGWQLREESRRSLSDDREAFDRVATMVGRTEASKCIDFSIGKLEKVLSATLTKREAKQKVEGILAGLLERKSVSKLVRVK